MLATTAQKFGSNGKSFKAPSAVAPVIGAALLASGTSETADTAWSPSAACLLPDILPVAGTLLSYGGSRQLAAGGTVTHSGAITATGVVRGSAFYEAGGATTGLYMFTNGMYGYVAGGQMLRVNAAGLDVYGAITASGNITTPKVAGTDTFGLTLSAGATTLDSSRLIYFGTAGSAKWRIDNLQGDHFCPVTANTYDIGGTGYEIRNGYFASQVKVGTGFGYQTNANGVNYSNNAVVTWAENYSELALADIGNGIGYSGIHFTDRYGVRADTTFIRGYHSSARLDVMSGDKSGYAALYAGAITCGAITASGVVHTSSYMTAPSGFYSVGSGGDALGYDFDVSGGLKKHVLSGQVGASFVCFGGTTSAYPAIKRNGTAINLRLGDDSADAALTCGAITASGNVRWLTNGGISNVDGTRYNMLLGNGNSALRVGPDGLWVFNAASATLILGDAYDLFLKRASSATLAQRNGLNAQCQIINKSYTSDSSQEALMLDAGKQISGNLGLYSYRGSAGGSNYPVRVGILAADGSTFKGLTVSTDGYVNIDSAAPFLTLSANGVQRGYVIHSGPLAIVNQVDGNAIKLQSAIGLQVELLNGNPAPISCGAITASGLVTADSFCSSSLNHSSRYVYLSSSAMYPGTDNMGLGTSGNPWGSSYFGAITASGAIDATSFRRVGNTTQALQSADGIWYIDGTAGIRYRDTGAGYATTFQVSNAGNLTCGAITASGVVAANAGVTLPVTQKVTFTDVGGNPMSLQVGVGAIRFGSQFTGYGELRPGGNGSPYYVGSPSVILATTSAVGYIGIGFGVDAGFGGGYFTLRPAGGTAKFRNVDNSADAPISCGAITASDTITISSGTYAGATVQQLSFKSTDNSSNGNIGFQGGSWNTLGLWGPGRALNLNPTIGITNTTATFAGTITHSSGSISLVGRTDLGANPAVFLSGGGTSMPVVRVSAYSGMTADYIQGYNFAGTKEWGIAGGGALTCGAITASGTIYASGGVTGQSIVHVANSVNGLPSIALRHDLNMIGMNADKRIAWYNTTGNSNMFSGQQQVAIGRADATTMGIYENASSSTLANLTCGAITASGNLTLSDVNLITGTTTGTIIATANSQKLGFWGATPIVQPTTSVAAATLVSNLGTPLTDTDSFDGYTLKQIVKALRIAGLLA